MANVDGQWECVTRTPMGAQESVLTIRSDGASFSGSNVGALGSIDIEDGKVDGDTLTWEMEISMPFPMKLSARATVTGDRIEGTVDAGAMGAMPMSGTRKA
ncbi:MAG: hypothetical protein AB7G25_14760 [Sphingomonadaceae bacterium]